MFFSQYFIVEGYLLILLKIRSPLQNRSSKKQRISNLILITVVGSIFLSMIFTAERSALGANIVGTKGNDFLVGSEEVNTIRALAGDDQVHGGPSRDKVYGEKGNDYVVGNEGGDSILGGKGIDTLNGGPGNDNVRGENSDDFLTGGEGDDTILGGSGNDSIFGSSGDDNLVAGPGDDYMVGGPGADRFSCGQGVDQIADFNPSEGDTMSGDC